MSTTKSPLEQALLEGQEIMNAARENAKEILAMELQPELDKIVKESLENSSEEKKEELAIDITDPEEKEEDTETEKEEDVVISTDEILKGGEEPKKDEEKIDIVDMTASPNDEVVDVFKKMNPEDGIEVKKDADQINIKDGENQYIVNLKENENCEDDIIYEIDLNDYMNDEGDNEEVIYEIELDDDSDFIENEVELDELARTHTVGRNQIYKDRQFYKNAESRVRSGDPRKDFVNEKEEVKKLNESIKQKDTQLNTINEEKESLKADLNKHKEALRDLRENLNQVALFNSNLAYVNRLFCEHSTTKDEKFSIIKRFDEIKTLNESKSLYKVITEELSKGKVNIEESIENKLNKTVSTSKSVITESSVVEDAQVKRIKELMKYTNSNK